MADTIELKSAFLNRPVRIDFYVPELVKPSAAYSLLLVNDGQDLVKMDFGSFFQHISRHKLIRPLVIAGIHCGIDRINEYGIASLPDFLGRGAKASMYERFIVSELIAYINGRFKDYSFTESAFAGFSLGALSALDIVWNNPTIFSRAGVFSGSLWWRSVSQTDKDYNQSIHRMMHVQIRKGEFRPGLKFFFECGELDEMSDRNKNGVIDSIDDTIDLMRELSKKGYREGRDFYYLQLADGRHDVDSWCRSIPRFLDWGWGAFTPDK